MSSFIHRECNRTTKFHSRSTRYPSVRFCRFYSFGPVFETPIRSSYQLNSASSPALMFSAFLHPCPSPSNRIYLTFFPLSSNECKMASAWDGGTTASSDPWRIYISHNQSSLSNLWRFKLTNNGVSILSTWLIGDLSLYTSGTSS